MSANIRHDWDAMVQTSPEQMKKDRKNMRHLSYEPVIYFNANEDGERLARNLTAAINATGYEASLNPRLVFLEAIMLTQVTVGPIPERLYENIRHIVFDCAASFKITPNQKERLFKNKDNYALEI